MIIFWPKLWAKNAGAVEEHMLTNQCDACHARDDIAHEARGNDDDDKFAPRSFGSTPPTIEEAMTPQVIYVVCTHLRLLIHDYSLTHILYLSSSNTYSKSSWAVIHWRVLSSCLI